MWLYMYFNVYMRKCVIVFPVSVCSSDILAESSHQVSSNSFYNQELDLLYGKNCCSTDVFMVLIIPYHTHQALWVLICYVRYIIIQTSLASKNGSAYVWRINLKETECHWRGWFDGLSSLFLSISVPRMLLLAGVDRLDKELTIAHMQGTQNSPLPTCKVCRTHHCPHARYVELDSLSVIILF